MSQLPRDVVVVAAVRTAVTKAGRGSLKDTRPDDLLVAALQGLLAKVPSLDLSQVDDVVIGCAFPEGEQGLNVARTAALKAGLPFTVPAMTVNRFCSSGLQSLAQAAAAIQAGWIDIAITGGVESMTMIPMGGQRPSPNPGVMEDDPGVFAPMGVTSENVATRFEVSRADQDAFALASNDKALAAIAEGRFLDEIVPVKTRVWQDGKWVEAIVDTDEGPRASTLEGLARLKPAFAVNGASTAGNSSQTSDGAAATLVMAREKAAALGLPVLGVLRAYTVVGVDPEIMGVGPRYAIPRVLEKAGLRLEDVEIFEINEAFASQALYCVRELGIDPALVNVNGSAIALGHPLGCTGAKLTATLLHEMKRRKVRWGLVSMCVGGGMGAAAVFEREG
ncbi:MAG: thiolase family protein [Deltaproteobacteria bacterium]|nr:thiolase family protein [Deltaproteobacteria bacterium]